MRINNITEFFHFARNNGLVNIHPEIGAFVRCMEEFGRMCPCDPQTAKSSKVGQCKSLYLNFIQRAPQFKDILLSKVSDNALELCNDGQNFLTITR